ncbi:Cuticle Protein CPAP3 [Hyalella azteca]|uniref:Cuticle Protein CPAP3 n=1 Tax=Hyalella azteca TaxID=294128 RepID=A0A6A0HDU0_HYAAZ|nr:Cuticle Protein CPAP3 [Hyalella azteca]
MSGLVLAQSCPPEDVHYYADSQFCDRYSECREGVASEQQCPDGLLFDDTITDGRYPCTYPSEVNCGSRTKKQPAQPTEHCGHQWGYFGSGRRSECGYFFNCVDGREFRFECPEGLAFSSVTYRCEYPDESPDCDAGDYLGFTCPSEPAYEQLLSQGNPRYRSSRDCRQFFLCFGTSPRLQTCDLGRVYNHDAQACDEPENVRGCESYYPADELKAIRQRKAIEAERAEKRRLAFEQRFADLNKRRDNSYN